MREAVNGSSVVFFLRDRRIVNCSGWITHSNDGSSHRRASMRLLIRRERLTEANSFAVGASVWEERRL